MLLHVGVSLSSVKCPILKARHTNYYYSCITIMVIITTNSLNFFAKIFIHPLMLSIIATKFPAI